MPVFMANEVWQEVKRYVQQVDRADAAEALVSVLIDNDISAEEIKDMFKGDSEVKIFMGYDAAEIYRQVEQLDGEVQGGAARVDHHAPALAEQLGDPRLHGPHERGIAALRPRLKG